MIPLDGHGVDRVDEDQHDGQAEFMPALLTAMDDMAVGSQGGLPLRSVAGPHSHDEIESPLPAGSRQEGRVAALMEREQQVYQAFTAKKRQLLL